MTRATGKPGPTAAPLPPGWPIAQHGDWLASVRRMSPGTVRLRRLQLARFARSYPDPWAVDRTDVSHYLLPYADQSARGLRAALHGFYEWAVIEAVDPRAGLDPTLGIRVHVPRAHARPCPDSVWRPVEARLWASPDPSARLVGLMVSLGARCGLRRAEIAALHTRDLDGSRLRIRGKGDVVRSVVASGRIVEAIRCAPAGYLFPGAYPGRPMTADAVGRSISRELPHPWAAHSLRHRYGTNLYGRTRDLLLVQQQMGHSSPATTQGYIQLETTNDDALAAILDE